MMKNIWATALVGLCLVLPSLAKVAADDAAPTPESAHGDVVAIDVEGAIGPASAAYVEQAIADARAAEAEAMVLRMDTPGGLDTAMRAIVKAINSSEVPIVGFVAPSGARAASAGTYILYACHVAAMAPGTNLGAATPVQIGGLPGRSPPELPGGRDENEGTGEPASSGDAKNDKLVNDASAYLRSLAQMRGRNAEWAEQAVRSAESLSSAEALALGVIDLIARDLDDLLAQIDGRTVTTAAGEIRLETAGLAVVEIAPDWHSRLLAIISNPNLAYILLLIGVYGLIYEFSNPGAVLPGTVGAVSLVLALYAFQLLPINYAGAALMLLGLALMVAEAFAPSFGALGISGVAAFVVGSLILVDTDAPGFGLSVPLVLSLALATSLLLFAVVALALRSRGRPVVTGSEELIGAVGTALSGFPGKGSVHLHGEVWSARSAVPIEPGGPVRVIARDGLSLIVSPAPVATGIDVSSRSAKGA
jgi:membrane-bound serine protease (ClpP class)